MFVLEGKFSGLFTSRQLRLMLYRKSLRFFFLLLVLGRSGSCYFYKPSGVSCTRVTFIILIFVNNCFHGDEKDGDCVVRKYMTVLLLL